MIADRDFDSTTIWRQSRYDAGVSQEYLANHIGVSRKTIQNWENGVSAPDFNQSSKWFEALGINPLPYFLGYIYPENMGNISAKVSDERVGKALKELIDDLPIEGKRQLLYLFYGDHGSSPRAVLNLITAHLHLPMRERIAQADIIVDSYEMDEATGNLVGKEHIKPDISLVKRAIEKAKAAVMAGNEGYQITDEK